MKFGERSDESLLGMNKNWQGNDDEIRTHLEYISELQLHHRAKNFNTVTLSKGQRI